MPPLSGNPPVYTRGYSFTQHSIDQPTVPQPGDKLDAEFDDIATASAGASTFSNEAKGYAQAAAQSATESGQHADRAQAAADAADESRDAIDNRIYPGSWVSAPTLRPDGSPIQEGDQYYDDTAKAMMVYRDGAWINYEGSANASATAAANSATAAANSAQAALNAQHAAEDAAAAATTQGMYDTLAQGEAATGAGKYFSVKQQFGKGAYTYRRTATGSVWVAVELVGTVAREIAAQRALLGTITPAIAGLTTHLWGQNAWEWDGRLIPNEVTMTVTPPTLNWLPDPFNPADEDGGTTPARKANTTTTTDPLGGNNAQELTATAQNQQTAYLISTAPNFPAADCRLRVWTKLLSGSGAWRLGGTSTNGIAITAGAAWDAVPWETTLPAFTGTTSVGVSTAAGNAASGIAMCGAAIFDPLAGESAGLPSLATMLAAQNAGHCKPSLAFPSAMPLGLKGSIKLDGATARTPIIYTDVNYGQVAKYSFGGNFDCAAIPVEASGAALAVDFNPDVTPNATNAHGMVGVIGATDSVVGRPGRLYVNPGFSVSVSKMNHYFPGEGKRTVFVTVDNGTTTVWLDGVPIHLGLVGTWTAPFLGRFILGAYTGTRPRRKTAAPYVGEAGGIFYAKGKALTQAEALQQDKHIRERLRLYGLGIAPRKVCAIVGGDSLAAFSGTWFWHMGECSFLSPRMHGHCEAEGGTKLISTPPLDDNWNSPRRMDALQERITCAEAAGYDEVHFWVLAGANDAIDSWIDNGYDYRPWKAQLLAWLAQVRSMGTRVRIWLLTMLPRAGSPDDLRLEQQRMAWNDDVRANWASWGCVDRVVDTGLGTERVNASGVVTPETIPGGTPMGDWRRSQGARTHSRNPAVTLNLSALSGASFTGLAQAGTFTSADVYRVITAAAGDLLLGVDEYGAPILQATTGEAVITSVNADGSQVTLSTTGYVPPPWPGELAAQTSRDSIVRTAFDGATLAAGSWTVRNDSSTTTRWFQTDGIHQGNPGGRALCEVVWPQLQSYQANLLGLAL